MYLINPNEKKTNKLKASTGNLTGSVLVPKHFPFKTTAFHFGTVDIEDEHTIINCITFKWNFIICIPD